MIGYRIKGYTSIYTNYERFIHVLITRHKDLEPGAIVEACRVCQGYVKGVDRRHRPTALSPLIEDWGSPHLDVLAMRSSYQRPTPSIAQLLVEA